MSDYDADILVWSERQSALLRRLASGERVNDQVDWENVIEEIESVGNEQLHAVTSLLRQALIHMLKAEAWPLSRDAPSWRADAIDFRTQASDDVDVPTTQVGAAALARATLSGWLRDNEGAIVVQDFEDWGAVVALEFLAGRIVA
jgi:hypothetical protein